MNGKRLTRRTSSEPACATPSRMARPEGNEGGEVPAEVGGRVGVGGALSLLEVRRQRHRGGTSHPRDLQRMGAAHMLAAPPAPASLGENPRHGAFRKRRPGSPLWDRSKIP